MSPPALIHGLPKGPFFLSRDFSHFKEGTWWCSKMHPMLLGLMAVSSVISTVYLCLKKWWKKTLAANISTCQHFLMCCLGSRWANAGCWFSITQPYSRWRRTPKRDLLYSVLKVSFQPNIILWFLNLFDHSQAYYCYLVCAFTPLKCIMSHDFLLFRFQWLIISVVIPVPF